MDNRIKHIAQTYAVSCQEEALELLRTLGRIPAHTRQEERRAVFCRDWLLSQGASDVSIDEAKNAVCEIACGETEDLVVFAAHTDIVFPDTQPLPLREENGRLYAPGICDDTANLVNLLMAAKYLLQNKVKLKCGILIVCNACEEGLGNLDGTKAIFAQYGSRIKAFYSFDGGMPSCCSGAVGSRRYQLTYHTAGGHSYSDFGTASAIERMCCLVEALYQIEPPTEAKTTFNVGRIEGGTTVNSIAQECRVLYEFRSTSQNCLKIMEEKFHQVLENFQGPDGEITIELLGVRPGSGPLDMAALAAFTQQSADIISSFCSGEIDFEAYSTDSNIPLSLGIPANTIGTVVGARAHTREEWIEISSMPKGLGIALSLMLLYTSDQSISN